MSFGCVLRGNAFTTNHIDLSGDRLKMIYVNAVPITADVIEIKCLIVRTSLSNIDLKMDGYCTCAALFSNRRTSVSLAGIAAPQ